MKQAVIGSSGKQFLVTEGQVIQVDHLDGKEKGAAVEFAEVLLTIQDEKISLGTPTVKGATVTGEVVDALVKGDKIRVATYKAKSRYRKVKGYRHQFTTVKVSKITG